MTIPSAFKFNNTITNNNVAIETALVSAFTPPIPPALLAALASSGIVGGVPVTPQGRLTLTSGIAVTTTDVSGALNIYYNLNNLNSVPIYNGILFIMKQIPTQLTLILDNNTGHSQYQAANTIYDLFLALDSNSNVIMGSGPGWANSGVGTSNRGTGAGTTELTSVSGLDVNANTITLRIGNNNSDILTVPVNQATYIGSFYATANGQATDSAQFRYLYNAYNQVLRPLLAPLNVSIYNYGTAAFRQANNSNLNQINMLFGQPSSELEAQAVNIVNNSTSTFVVAYGGIGINQSIINNASLNGFTFVSNLQALNMNSFYKGFPGLGLNFAALLEYGNSSAGTTAFFGNTTGAPFASGIQGSVYA